MPYEAFPLNERREECTKNLAYGTILHLQQLIQTEKIFCKDSNQGMRALGIISITDLPWMENI